MEDATVCEATADDAEAIRRVARKSWHAAYDDISGADAVESVVSEWYEIEGLTESIEREDGRFLVAETGDGELVGFAQAVLGDEEAAHLPRIYVRPDCWGEGVGSALLESVESWLRDCGVERLRLIVLADNEAGNAFYEKSGYRTIASRESEFEGETVAEYVREKEL